MKAFLRQPWVISLLAGMITGYLRFTYWTFRWTIEGGAMADAVKANPDAGASMCVWHSGIPMSPTTWDPKSSKKMNALVSRSSDGELITQIFARLGFPAIRGSRTRENSVGDKGGSAAFREMVRWLKAGNAVAITPDGPKGPVRIMTEGAATVARAAGAQVLMVGIACRPCIRVNSWDTTVFPLPFARAAMVWDGPFTAEKGDDLAAITTDWGVSLNAVTDRAEAILA